MLVEPPVKTDELKLSVAPAVFTNDALAQPTDGEILMFPVSQDPAVSVVGKKSQPLRNGTKSLKFHE